MKLKFFRVCEKCDDVSEVSSEAEALMDICEKCSKNIKCCVFCKKDFTPEHKYGQALYCSKLCRSRAAMIRNGTSAKPFKCKDCGVIFKRRCAKNINCQDCRDKLKLGEKLSIKHANYPQISREKELELQAIWLEENKLSHK